MLGIKFVYYIEKFLNAATKSLNIYYVYTREYPNMLGISSLRKIQKIKIFYKKLLGDKRFKFLDQNMNINKIIKQLNYINKIYGSLICESLKLAKFYMIFGWVCFPDCKSCHFIKYDKSFINRIEKTNRINIRNVSIDLNTLTERIKKRLIYYPVLKNTFEYFRKSYRDEVLSNNISEAIKFLLMFCEKSINKNLNF